MILSLVSDAFAVLFEDRQFFLAYKPACLHSVSIAGSERSAVSEFDGLTSGKFGFVSKERGLLYRLDYVTSGLLLFAKTREALEELRRIEVSKTYYALVSDFSGDGFPVSGFCGFSKLKEMRKRLDGGESLDYVSYFRPYGRNAAFQRPVFPECVAHYKGKRIRDFLYETIIEKRGNAVKCVIKRGARHQIRATMSSLFCPIDGDVAYGSVVSREDGSIALECRGLDFTLDGKRHVFDLGEFRGVISDATGSGDGRRVS